MAPGPDWQTESYSRSSRRAVHAVAACLPEWQTVQPEKTMPGLLPNVDPTGLLEFSVVYTDRALNHMSQNFQGVMRDISAILKEVYHARSAVLVPGSAPSAWKPWRASSPTTRRCW